METVHIQFKSKEGNIYTFPDSKINLKKINYVDGFGDDVTEFKIRDIDVYESEYSRVLKLLEVAQTGSCKHCGADFRMTTGWDRPDTCWVCDTVHKPRCEDLCAVCGKELPDEVLAAGANRHADCPPEGL